ncbi:hypothetical protein [Algivirga pacifica]|uniref:DNA polymerase III subunit gamma/tau n=1 Tax=Algivirga pacifica TaxID=1162670 RepID=A0ABP9D0Z0_9BACT
MFVHWKSFTEKTRKAGASTLITLLLDNADLELKEKETILIKLSNPVQQQQLQDIQAELLKHLKEGLQNNFIQLQSTVIKVEQKTEIPVASMKFNNPLEKMQFLLKKYPKLKKLQSNLGLDLDD